jgi:hypothetical protein
MITSEKTVTPLQPLILLASFCFSIRNTPANRYGFKSVETLDFTGIVTMLRIFHQGQRTGNWSTGSDEPQSYG